MNKFFIDSCIFIENFKKEGNPEAKRIWNKILEHFKENIFLINLIVKNEIIYHLFSKRKLISIKKLKLLLNAFENLNLNMEIENLMYFLIKRYNLKPNDALILATCKYYKIKYLISLDEDFKEPCEKEGITLINSAEKLKEVLENKI